MNEPEHFSRQTTLADYLAVIRRRRWVVIQAVVIVPLVALLFSFTQSARFEATSDVILSQQDLGAQLTGIQDPSLSQDPTRFVQNQAAIAELPPVAQLAVKQAQIKGLTAAAFMLQSHVTADPNANRLYFVVKAPNARDAMLLSTRYAEAFRTYKSQLETASLGLALQQVQNQINQLKKRGVSTTSAAYTNLSNRQQELRTLQLLHSPNALIRPAERASQVQPRTKRNVALGVALGLLIGIGLAFLWEALDSTVRSVDEVEQTLGLPVLGRIAPPSYENPRGVEVAIASHGPAVEAFRQLRTNLEYANRDLGAHAIMITSALPREGKSRTIVNLAAAVASMGERVVLIDLDLRQPALHRFAQIPNKAGAVDVIRGTSTLQEGLVNVPFSPSNNDGRKLTSGVLRILPAGQLGSHDPTRILAPDILRRLLDGLREKTDVILIDTPPMLAVADAAIISSAVDAVLVVTRMGMVPRQALRELGRALDRTSAPRLGFVATGTDDAGTYGYGQYTAAPPLAAAS